MLSRYCDWKYTDLHELEQVNFMMSCMMSYFEGAGNDHSPHKDFRTCHRGWRAMLLHHHGCHTPRPTLRCWDPPQDPLWGHRWQSEATASQMVVHLMLSSGDLWSAPSLVRLRTDSEFIPTLITSRDHRKENNDQKWWPNIIPTISLIPSAIHSHQDQWMTAYKYLIPHILSRFLSFVNWCRVKEIIMIDCKFGL